jgi:hypothetical protein
MPSRIAVEICTKLLVKNDEPVWTRENSEKPVLWFKSRSKGPNSMSKFRTTPTILDLLHKGEIIYRLFLDKHAEVRAGGCFHLLNALGLCRFGCAEQR